MQTIDIQVSSQAGLDDYTIVLHRSEVTVAQVFEALGLCPSAATVDGQRIASPRTALAAEVITAGRQLASADTSARAFVSASADRSDGIEVAAVAGLDAGAIAVLPAGLHQINAASGCGWYVDVGEDRVRSPSPWHTNAPSIEAVVIDQGALALSGPTLAESINGRVVHRPPRLMPPEQVETVTLQEAPEAVKPASPLSWVTLLAPVPIAVLMAVFFRPIFALFAAMGPVMALGRWFESRRRFRRDSRTREAAVQAVQRATDDDVRNYLELEAQRRWLTHPHVAELWRRSRSASVRLWECRSPDRGFLEVGVGIAPDTLTVPFEGAKVDEEVHAAVVGPQQLRAVPHTVDLLANQGVGIYGIRPGALAVARSIVLQLATLHGPADMRIGIVVETASVRDWDWLKWLPHHDSALSAASAKPVVATLAKPLPAAGRASSFMAMDTPADSVDLIIVDTDGADVAALQRAAVQGDRHVRFIVLAEHSTRLPAACSSLMAVASAVAELTTPELAGRRQLAVPVGVSVETARAWARSMAGLIDPEVDAIDRLVESPRVGILGLLGFDSTASVIDRWDGQATPADPVAVIGVGPDEAFSVDLVQDGPHALVAGTTGSGKSELLRTLVLSLAYACPPDQLNFVLVDFKGGGAFDAVDQLPHVAGLITDLDESLVARAIGSMRAELHRREQLFRKLGVSDFERACQLTSESLARLVIVIDEFAVLAADYGELMSSLVDLAARGRSLGIHLVLATQRPTGVVDQKIRANTNLRIALRVQDKMDSQDVIGVPDAAAIDRSSPGRAIISVGGDTPVAVQTAYSGAPDLRMQGCEVRPHSLFGAGGGDLPTRDGCTPTELEVLVDAIRAAASTQSGCVRPLWTPPLPASLDWIDLGARVLAEPDQSEACSIAIGLVDLPESQAQRPWRWTPTSGPLAIYGANAQCGARALVSIGAALASSASPDSMHLYVVDGDGGGTASLEGLPHTGAYITLSESDRFDRVLRLFETALESRRRATEGAAPSMVLMVDNLASVLAVRNEVTAASIIDRLGALARDGSGQGLHLVVTARAVREIGHRLAQQIPNRLVLDLADPSSYLSLGLKANDIVALQPMRAIDVATQRLVQLVEPPDLTSWASGAAHDLSGSPRRIGTFPSTVDHESLDMASLTSDGTLTIPVGVESIDLTQAALRLRPGDHALVVAAPGMGRSAFCRMVVAALQPTAVDVVAVVPNASSGPWADTSGCEFLMTPQDIDALAGADRRTVVVVDDSSRLDAEMAAALERLIANHSTPITVVAATSFEFARGVRSWVRAIRSGGTGVLLGATAADGDLLRVRLGPVDGLGVLPGRGHLVSRGRVQAIQAAMPRPHASETYD